MEEHRRATRQRVFKGAKIVFNGGASLIDCTIRDLSETGARARVVSPIGVPDRFTLLLADGERYACRVVWRRVAEIGITFEPPA